MSDNPEGILMVEKGVRDVGAIPLSRSVCLLGSSPQADVVLDNPYVSRQHARIVQEGIGFQIHDMGSKNGTFVNGARIKEDGVRLRAGDKIEFSRDQVVLTFQQRSGTLTQTLPASPGSDLRVDSGSRDVWTEEEKLEPPLSRKEFDVLNLLFQRDGEACSRDEIAATGWPERTDSDVSDQEIDQYIRRLRLRIEPDPSHPRYILTIRRYGYKLSHG